MIFSGLAIYNSINLEISLSTCIFKKLLGGKGEFQDLEFAHPDVYRSLTQLLEADKVIGVSPVLWR
jgi:hypothetical protein